MKTLRVVGCVAVAYACAVACGGARSSFSPASSAGDGGDAESDAATGDADANGGDDGDVASAPSEGGAIDSTTNAAPGASNSQYCCVSGAYYVCPNQATPSQCTGFDLSACLQSCPPSDGSCTQACGEMASNARPDVSGCSHEPSKDGICTSLDAGSYSSNTNSSTSSGSASPPTATKNSCGGYFLGTDCTAGLQCVGGGHCTQNKCYPDDVGNPCTFPDDCGQGNHCTAGCCASPAKGSACNTSLDCTSGKCTSGVCQ